MYIFQDRRDEHFPEQKCKQYQKALRIGLVNYLGERLKIHFSFLYCPVIYASKKGTAIFIQRYLNIFIFLDSHHLYVL